MWILRELGVALALVWSVSTPCYGQHVNNARQQLAANMQETKKFSKFFENNLLDELNSNSEAIRILSEKWQSPEKFIGKDFLFLKKCKDGKFRLAFFNKWKIIMSTIASPGKTWHRTPSWKYKTWAKDIDHRSNLYDKHGKTPTSPDRGAPMFFAIHVHGAIYIHAWHTTWFEASHWCIRIPIETARILFEIIENWTDILICTLESVNYPSNAEKFKPKPFTPWGEKLVSQKDLRDNNTKVQKWNKKY